MSSAPAAIRLEPVSAGNWSDCAALAVADAQRAFVAPVTYYLAMCAYGDTPWRPWAVDAAGATVGFVMSAIDPADGSLWIGGLVIDAAHQRRGYGRAVVESLIARAVEERHLSVGLSFHHANTVARALYAGLGFVETDERVDGEIVARLRLA